MDGQESVEFELDWDAIEHHAMLYDQGARGYLEIRSKMLQLAYYKGYQQCESDHAEIVNNFQLLMSRPEGHA